MNPPKLERNLRIVKLIQAGMSFTEIAKLTSEYNTKPLSRQAVQNIYKNLALKLKSQ